MTKDATLRFERSFAADGHRFVAGADEVGRGALAGPVSVGMVVVDTAGVKHLKGVRDSKLLAPANRELLVPRIRSRAAAWAVGHATAAEIDEFGLTAALRLAGTRAWLQVCAVVRPDIVILDGNHNWLSPAQATLFDALGAADDGTGCDAPVRTRIKADLQCLSVAAASVLAKVERDAMMARLALEHPGYGWEVNKGYATEAHRAAILAQGACEFHRRSWRLAPPFPDGV
ncbi:ribonuclease HII [Arthrobacter sp. GCM10027362]|uniref:ribonuclease HII n=1 Tax=Arthrobacter sp. GCM10027362 TaxID=3273379 RepID=UPI0036457309